MNLKFEFKSIITLLFLLSICFHVQSQNTKYPLEESFYISINDLDIILDKITKAPIVNERCKEPNCDKIKKYYTSLFNFKKDLELYKEAIEASKNISKNQWKNYFNQTFDNEELKTQLTRNLALREALTNISSVALDVASLTNALQTGSGVQSKSTLTQLTAAVAALDGMLSSLNLLMKVLTGDTGTTVIGTISSDDWNNIYSVLRGVYELITESLALYKKVDNALGALEDIKEMKRLRKANLVAAVVQFVNIYVSYQNKQMKKHLTELDNVLTPNQRTQTLHYEKFILKRRLSDKMDHIFAVLNTKYYGLRELNKICNGNVKREARDTVIIEERKFGHALKYYKSVLLKQKEGIDNNWAGINDCYETSRKYQFQVYDGIGKKSSAYLRIYRKSDGKKLYESSTSNAKKFNLFPDVYNIEMYKGYTSNNIEYEGVELKDFEITGDEKSNIIDLKPFGRINLDVVDKSGKPLQFGYKFLRNNKLVASAFTESSKIIVRDLHANSSLDLKLNVGWDSEIKKGITLVPGKINKLHYVFDDGKFIEEKIEVIEIPITDLRVKINSPLNNISNKSIVDFSASSNILKDASFMGYLKYNGIEQQVKPEGGNFSGKLILNNGINHINFSIKKGDTLVYQENISVSYFGKRVRLKAVLVWDSKADIDLHLRDPNNEECYYKNKVTKLASLDVDNKIAYGPENINVESGTFGEYGIFINNYSKTPGVKATVYIFIDGKLDSKTDHIFSEESNYYFVKSIKF